MQEKLLVSEAKLDPLFHDAARMVVQTQQGSTDMLYRKLKIGKNRAEIILNQLESAGILGEHKDGEAREVKIKKEADLDSYLENAKVTIDRYSLNYNLFINRETAINVLRQTAYTKAAEDEWVNEMEQEKLAATALFLNWKLKDSREYLIKMWYSTWQNSMLENATQKSIESEAKTLVDIYKNLLIDNQQ